MWALSIITPSMSRIVTRPFTFSQVLSTFSLSSTSCHVIRLSSLQAINRWARCWESDWVHGGFTHELNDFWNTIHVHTHTHTPTRTHTHTHTHTHPNDTCLMVTAGLQSFSSSNNDKQTVPEGYTFGWKSGGSNLPVTRISKSKHVHL